MKFGDRQNSTDHLISIGVDYAPINADEVQDTGNADKVIQYEIVIENEEGETVDLDADTGDADTAPEN